MNRIADRKGNITELDSAQDWILEWMYGHMAGRLILRPLVSPLVSKLVGIFLSSGISCFLIRPFVQVCDIDLSGCEKRPFYSYNDFFQRKMLPGVRPVNAEPEVFVSPCDGKVSVWKMDQTSVFRIKHTQYTARQLLRNKKLADRYAGGYLWVFRLSVADYHRYIYIDRGVESEGIRIPGVFHTVNPAANDVVPVYKENTREYSLLRTENFGTVLQMEVGALLVGRIENFRRGRVFCRGQEKGVFAYGGSTILLMTQKGRVIPDRDLLENSRRGTETAVLQGEAVGRADCRKQFSKHCTKQESRTPAEE